MTTETPNIIPAGEYKAVIAHRERRTSSQEIPYVNCKLVVIEGPHAGAILFGNYSAHENSRWAYEEVVDEIDQLDVGLQFYVHVKQEDWGGSVRNMAGKLTLTTVPDHIERRIAGRHYIYRLEKEV